MSKIREFTSTLPQAGKPAVSGDDQAGPPPDDVFAQILQRFQADGYDVGAKTCAECKKEYDRCIDETPDGVSFKPCQQKLEECFRKCLRNPPDASGLTAGVLYVSINGGKTSAAQPPQHEQEYDFCVPVVNKGQNHSGKYRVRFELKGPVSGAWTVHEDDGLMPGQAPITVYHYGDFSKPGKFELSACVFAESDPSKMISCADSISFEVK